MFPHHSPITLQSAPLDYLPPFIFHIPLIYAIILQPLLFLSLTCPYDPRNPVWQNAINNNLCSMQQGVALTRRISTGPPLGVYGMLQTTPDAREQTNTGPIHYK